MDMQKIGARLKRAREAKCLSQEDAAGQRMATRTLSRLESGIGNPTLDTLEALARVYGVSVSDLIAEADGPTAPNTAIPEVAAAVDFLAKFAGLERVFQLMVLTLVHKNTRYTQGVQVPPTARAEIQRLFGPLLKARP